MLLAACLGRLYDSPYILVSGLGETRSLTIDVSGDLLAASSTGLWRIGPDGAMHHLDPGEAQAASIDPRHRYRFAGSRVEWEGGGADVPGAVDIAASWFDELWVLWPDHVEAIGQEHGRRPVTGGLAGGRAVALGGPDQMLVLTQTEVWAVGRAGERALLATGLEDVRAAGADRQGRVYVVDGETLLRLDPAGPTTIARYLDDVRDLQFAAGPRLLPDFVYLATGEGRVDYLQVPP